MTKLLAATACLAFALSAAASEPCLQSVLRDTADAPPTGQIVVSTRSPDGERDTAVIPGASAGRTLDGDEGFRIASVTKTYVAAAVLRLHEDGRIDLDAGIDAWLPEAWLRLLSGDGYRPDAITVRHLLSHTSGLSDHAQAPQFIAAVQAEPDLRWTRDIKLRRLVEWTDPAGAPGERYAYSDTGYVLLGEIVEHVTGRDLPAAVRDLLRLDRLGLDDTWWEAFEPADGRVRARQVYDGADTYHWHPSLDLYGGGGLVASTADMAAFFAALLEGRVFDRPQTLALMQSPAGLPGDSPYRLGLLTYAFDGVDAIGHSGFWGTLVVREPASGRVIAGAVTDRADFPRLRGIVAQYLHRVAPADTPETSADRCARPSPDAPA